MGDISNWDKVMELEDQGTDDIDKGLGGGIVEDQTEDPEKGSEKAQEENNNYLEMSDKEIVKRVLKSTQEKDKIKNDFKTLFESNYKWVPKESLLSYNISEDRRYRIWVVKSLVMIRDDGRCRICGERVRGNTWKVVKEVKRIRTEESNCFLICKDCGLCHSFKEFSENNRVRKFQRMKLMVLKRRLKGVKNCGKLKETGLITLVKLEREFSESKGYIDPRLVRSEILREKRKG
ncbi:MAG: hypothetical protein GY841_00020 [FCB group bacterium]|nr:hypothetical protein [FCB group bacterium]